MMKLFKGRRPTQRGYSLIEVLIAMGLLSSVLLVIVTLFYMARRNVYGGKKMTNAVAVGTRVMEDLSTLSATTALSSFNISATTAIDPTVTLLPSTMPESTYPNAIVRSTRSVATPGGCDPATPPLIAFDNDPQLFLRRWYCHLMATNNEVPNGSVTLVFSPRDVAPAGATLNPMNATTVRVRAIIRWREGARWRQIVLDQTKQRRP